MSSLLIVPPRSVRALEWSGDTRLTVDESWDASPSITCTQDGDVWVVWTAPRTGLNDIFYKVYHGSVWSNEIQLTTHPEKDISPSITQAADGKIWVVWSSYRSTLDYNIYFKVFDGVSWSADTELVGELQDDNCPAVAKTADGKIWVVWSSLRTGDPEIFYKVFDGSNWSSDTRLTFNQNDDDEDPSVVQSRDDKVWVAWSKTAQATDKWGDIYYKTFDGSSWSSEVQLTSVLDNDVHPSIMQSMNDRVWVTWDSDRDGFSNQNIYYKVFDGSTWTADTRLTNAMESDETPSMTQIANGSIWVVWSSPRVLAQLDIYLRIGMELHDVAVLGVSYYASHNTTAFRGEKVYIEVGVQNNGEARELSVQVRCYANSSLIGSRTTALLFGQFYSMVFTWNTDPKAKPGMYVISADVAPVVGEVNVGDNSLIGDSLEIRIRGDIVGVYGGVVQPIPDRRVDIDDFSIPIIHFGCTGPAWKHPEWDPVANVKEDLIIDLDDIMAVGVHFGES